MEKHSNDLVHTEATTRSLFEVRHRLWHEPPELDYSGFESYDDIQQELKARGGEHFQWKTNWPDLTVERHLLLDYMCWASGPERDESLPQAEREFYYHLYDSLVVDRGENMAGLESNNQRFGMKGEDWRALYWTVHEMRQDWKRRVVLAGHKEQRSRKS